MFWQDSRYSYETSMNKTPTLLSVVNCASSVKVNFQNKSFGNLFSFFSWEYFFYSQLNSSFKKIYPLLKIWGESGGTWPEIKDGRKKFSLTWYNSFLFSTRPSHENEHLGPTKIINQKLVTLVKRPSSWRHQTNRGFLMFYGSTERDQ